MAKTSQRPHEETPERRRLSRLGVVVHPTRTIDGPLRALTSWASAHDVDVVQVPVPGQGRRVADLGDAADCDLIVSIGGDGTMLAAIRAAIAAGRPALGLACGSLGVLTAVDSGALGEALERFRRGDWVPERLPALAITPEGADELLAINDVAIIRGGIGQLRVASFIDGVLFNRLAGDGCIVSTPAGSSAYSLAAGSVLLSPDTDAYLLTPLPSHGGSRYPLVIRAQSELRLEVSPAIGGVRLEVDGQVAAPQPQVLTIRLRPAVVTVVAFSDDEPLFTSLRRRQIIVDSPRILADDARG